MKHKASRASNQTQKKQNNVVDIASSDDGSQISEPIQNNDDRILDMTKVEKSKREEAVKKISEYTCGFDEEKYSPLIRKTLGQMKGLLHPCFTESLTKALSLSLIKF